MNGLAEHITNQLGIIIAAAVIAQFFAYKLRIHSIVLLVISGLLIGPVFKIVEPEHLFGNLFHIMIEFSIIIILFEGGLNLKLHELRDVAAGLKRLISLGVIINGTLTFLAAHYIGGFSIPVSMILASILVVTGPTVIVPALRQARLPRKINSYLKWEGIMNDPIGILITIILYQYLISQEFGASPLTVIAEVFKAIVISITFALTTGITITNSIKRFLIPDFLKVPMILSSAILLYIFSTNVQDGSGLLTVTIYSVYLGNQHISIMTELRRFKESMSTILISFVFIVLASSIDFDTISQLSVNNYIFIALVVFLIRPVSIMLSTIRSEMNFSERLLVGWFGPRGVVAVSMAGIIGLEMYEHGFSSADKILAVVFMVVIATIIIHSSTLSIAAKALGLSSKSGNGLIIVGSSYWSTQLAKLLKSLDIPVMIIDSNMGRLNKAKSAGIKIFNAEILENIENGVLDFSEYGYLLAATENDSYNALVCQKVLEDLGAKNIFQIPINNQSGALTNLPKDLGGRIIEATELVYDNLQEKSFSGWSFEGQSIDKKVNISELNNDDSYNLFVIHSDKSLSIVSKDLDLEEGDVLVNFSKKRTS